MKHWRRLTFAVLVTMTCAGCNWFEPSDQEPEFEFPELTATPEPGGSAAAKPQPAASGNLSLRLKVGDRFPLKKTVEQTLSHPSSHGLMTSRSLLELMLAVRVEEIRDGRTRLGVRYHRVRYMHDIAGEQVMYDSDQPETQIPPAAQAYHAMVNNGFSFWLGPDRKIAELVDFRQFVDRCLDAVPAAHRAAAAARFSGAAAEEIANFVDDSVGLLPAGNSGDLQVGQSWQLDRRFGGAAPMRITNQCTLKKLDDARAEIELIGTIAADATATAVQPADASLRLQVRGGHCFGSSTIDRATGLPLDSRVEQYIDMQVVSSDGQTFEQRKQIVTTIAAWPDQSLEAMPAGAAGPSPAPQPVFLPR